MHPFVKGHLVHPFVLVREDVVLCQVSFVNLFRCNDGFL